MNPTMTLSEVVTAMRKAGFKTSETKGIFRGGWQPTLEDLLADDWFTTS